MTTLEVQTKPAMIPIVSGPRLRGKIDTVLGSISVEQIVPRFYIPHRDSTKKTGYQRELQISRVNKLVDDLRKGRVDLPTALLLNMRAFDRAEHLIEEGTQLWIRLPLQSKLLYVVDGQHRVEAVRRLFEDDESKWGSLHLPFVLMLGAKEIEEMEAFYVVNANAKSVRTDLALDLLKQRAENDPSVMSALTERGESWKVVAQGITEALANEPIWRGKIRFPGDSNGGRTISSNGMASSLRPLVTSPFFSAIKLESQIQILMAYWNALADLLPEAFRDPEAFTVQKAVGVQAFHRVLVDILERIRSDGRSPLEREAFVKVLRTPLDQLEGDTTSGDVARGTDFWKSGSEGGAGSYTSHSGQRVLVAKLINLLPELAVE